MAGFVHSGNLEAGLAPCMVTMVSPHHAFEASLTTPLLQFQEGLHLQLTEIALPCASSAVGCLIRCLS